METELPMLPEPACNGCHPAVERVRVIMAQQMIADRQKAGLSQTELAQRAGLR